MNSVCIAKQAAPAVAAAGYLNTVAISVCRHIVNLSAKTKICRNCIKLPENVNREWQKTIKKYIVVCFEFNSTFARFLSQLPEKLIAFNQGPEYYKIIRLRANKCFWKHLLLIINLFSKV